MMKLSEATQLINQALTPVDKEWYTLDVVFNRDVEKVRIHKKHIPNIVQDVLCYSYNGPCCTLYMQSRRRLTKEEEQLYTGKYDSLDKEKYNELKWEMLEIDLPADPTMFERFKSLGFNPTGAIDYDNKTRFHFNNLLRKQWMSKRDSQAGKTKSDICKEMRDDLRADPKKAFVTNRYLPSIIDYYREK